MKTMADTNTSIAVALNEPEKDRIIRLAEGHDLIAPDVLPFEIGNALTAMMKMGYDTSLVRTGKAVSLLDALINKSSWHFH